MPAGVAAGGRRGAFEAGDQLFEFGQPRLRPLAVAVLAVQLALQGRQHLAVLGLQAGQLRLALFQAAAVGAQRFQQLLLLRAQSGAARGRPRQLGLQRAALAADFAQPGLLPRLRHRGTRRPAGVVVFGSRRGAGIATGCATGIATGLAARFATRWAHGAARGAAGLGGQRGQLAQLGQPGLALALQRRGFGGEGGLALRGVVDARVQCTRLPPQLALAAQQLVQLLLLACLRLLAAAVFLGDLLQLGAQRLAFGPRGRRPAAGVGERDAAAEQRSEQQSPGRARQDRLRAGRPARRAGGLR